MMTFNESIECVGKGLGHPMPACLIALIAWFSPHTLETWYHLPMKTKFHAGVPSRAFQVPTLRVLPSPMSRSRTNTRLRFSSLGATLWVVRFGLPLERGGVELFHPPPWHLWSERERWRWLGMGWDLHALIIVHVKDISIAWLGRHAHCMHVGWIMHGHHLHCTPSLHHNLCIFTPFMSHTHM